MWFSSRASLAVNSNAQNTITKLNVQQSKRFLHPLPSEIMIQITPYLDQRDCLTCMAVCRSWYTTVPEYMQQVWEKVIIRFSRIPKNNRRWEQCIGMHAKNIVLVYDGECTRIKQLRIMIQRLIECNCGPLDCLEFTMPDKVFLNKQIEWALLELKKMTGPAIPQITVNNTSSSIGFLDTLYAFPDIAQFTFKNIEYVFQEPLKHLQQRPLPQFHHLTHLFLDADVDAPLQLVPVLRNTPNLQYLSYGLTIGQLVSSRFSNPPNIHPDTLFSLCPKLIYLESNARHTLLKYRSRALDLIQQSNGTGLRSIIECQLGDDRPSQMAAHFARNKDTLEFVALCCYHDWTPVLSRLQCLRVLVLDCHFGETQYEPIQLSHFPDLEELVLHGHGNMVLNTSVLKSMKQLKRLFLADLKIQCDAHDLGLATIADIHLNYVSPMTDTLLDAIAPLASLRQLSIALDRKCPNSQYNLPRFVEQLDQVQQLQLDNNGSLSGPVLRALSHLPALRYFKSEVACMDDLDSAVDLRGLVELLNASPSLMKVEVQQNKWGPWFNTAAVFLQGNVSGYNVTAGTPNHSYPTAIIAERQ